MPDATLCFPAHMEDKLDKILTAIEQSRTATKDKSGTLMTWLGFLHDDHSKLADRVAGREKTLTSSPMRSLPCDGWTPLYTRVTVVPLQILDTIIDKQGQYVLAAI
ncbi:hypothetical protein NDU88_003960 [Pleurodeles waltl]|uniref:Uncharacterized protein n=1 Tax=Pleurodeles waltl TaxID=8319 RepID=A0AAV7MA99_PLEWA|nr:hypothetical protein NDU88_003960 [Pleurodeles waltl]